MMAGFVPPPPTALMAQIVVLSTKLVAGYPHLSVVVVAAGTVMPGVHEGAPETALQLLPILPPVDLQLEPLQQRLGLGEVWGVHVRPGAQLPLESQRHPWVPMMQVVGAPEPVFVPPSSPRIDPSLFPKESPSLPPASEPDVLPASEPDEVPESKLDGDGAEPPHPHTTSSDQSGAPRAP
jgi:hypothetical protein